MWGLNGLRVGGGYREREGRWSWGIGGDRQRGDEVRQDRLLELGVWGVSRKCKDCKGEGRKGRRGEGGECVEGGEVTTPLVGAMKVGSACVTDFECLRAGRARLGRWGLLYVVRGGSVDGVGKRGVDSGGSVVFSSGGSYVKRDKRDTFDDIGEIDVVSLRW